MHGVVVLRPGSSEVGGQRSDTEIETAVQICIPLHHSIQFPHTSHLASRQLEHIIRNTNPNYNIPLHSLFLPIPACCSFATTTTTVLCYDLTLSAILTPRTALAILENNQGLQLQPIITDAGVKSTAKQAYVNLAKKKPICQKTPPMN